MNWTLFATILAQIEPPLDASTLAISGALIGYLAPSIVIGLTLWLTITVAMDTLSHSGGEPITPLLRQCAIVVGVWTVFMVSAHYTYTVHQFIQVGLPNALQRVVSSSAGGAPLGANTFDAIWNKALVAGLEVYKKLPWTAIGLQFVVVLYLFAALISIGIGFLIWLVALVMLSLLVATGPIFVFVFVFPFLSSIFERWLAGMASMVVLKVFVAVLLTILTSTEDTIIGKITSQSLAPGGQAASNEIAQLGQLLGGVLLFFIVGVIASQLPGMAQSITSGLHVHLDRMVRQAYGAVTSVGGSVATAADAAATRALRAALGSGGGGTIASAGSSGVLPSPPGRSLSSARP